MSVVRATAQLTRSVSTETACSLTALLVHTRRSRPDAHAELASGTLRLNAHPRVAALSW